MFALTGKSRGKSRIAPKRRELDGRLVVPRMLRRPARLFSKIFAGDITVPRYAEAAGLASSPRQRSRALSPAVSSGPWRTT